MAAVTTAVAVLERLQALPRLQSHLAFLYHGVYFSHHSVGFSGVVADLQV